MTTEMCESVSQTPPPLVDSQSRSVCPLHLPTPPHTSIVANSFHFILNFGRGWGLLVTPGQLGARYCWKLSKEIISTVAANSSSTHAVQAWDQSCLELVTSSAPSLRHPWETEAVPSTHEHPRSREPGYLEPNILRGKPGMFATDVCPCPHAHGIA